MSTIDVVLETLTEKIQRQERCIAQLQDDLERARASSVIGVLGPLRLREAVLLYVGQDTDAFSRKIAEDFGDDVAQAVMNSLFVLDNAPIPPEVRESIREATDHGSNRL